jgi:DNA (cytosine-5)-methyltransferase 1
MTPLVTLNEADIETEAAGPRELVLLSNARRMLAEARMLDEVKDIRDKAEAIRLYAKQSGDGLEIQNAAAEIRVRAERRAGELLDEMDIKPGNPQWSSAVTIDSPSLGSLGITKNQSSAWQRIASIPSDDFEGHIQETKEAGKELTTASVVRLAKQSEPKPEPAWDIVAAAAHVDRTIARLFEAWPAEHHEALAVQIEAYTRASRTDPAPARIEAVAPFTPTGSTEARPFTYGSVCSGIEAATVAWEPLGWVPKWFAEVAEFPSAVLAHRYPDVPNLGDFTTIGEEHGPIDLLVGGTPCQAFSVNGLRGGLADERGNLALEYLRLAQRLAPAWLAWENVPGVLSVDRGRAFHSFLRGLEELGYGWAYRVLDAQHFGVPQRRRRVFVVGCLGNCRPAVEALFEPESLSTHPRKARAKRAAAAARTGFDNPSLFGADGDDEPGGDRRLIYGWNGDEEFKYSPGIATTLRAAQGGEGNGFAAMPDIVCQYTPIERERLIGFPDNYTQVPYKGRPAELCPDKPRSHALGNSMAVPCMSWIGGRIKAINTVLPRLGSWGSEALASRESA